MCYSDEENKDDTWNPYEFFLFLEDDEDSDENEED